MDVEPPTATPTDAEPPSRLPPVVSHLTPAAARAFHGGEVLPSAGRVSRDLPPVVPVRATPDGQGAPLESVLPHVAHQSHQLQPLADRPAGAFAAGSASSELVGAGRGAAALGGDAAHSLYLVLDHTDAWPNNVPAEEVLRTLGATGLIEESLLVDEQRRRYLAQLDARKERDFVACTQSLPGLPTLPALDGTHSKTLRERFEKDAHSVTALLNAFASPQTKARQKRAQAAGGGGPAPVLVTQPLYLPERGALVAGSGGSSVASSSTGGGRTSSRAGSSSAKLVQRRAEERAAEMRTFFVNDALDLRTGFERPPQAYPLLGALEAHLHEYLQREVASQLVPGSLPRVPSPPAVPRRYMLGFFLPPGPSERRLCAAGRGCLMFVHAQHEARASFPGYVGREFVLPAVLAEWRAARHIPTPEEQPVGHCIDCLLFRWTEAVYLGQQSKTLPTQPMNTFTVLIGEGEYAPTVMLPVELDGRATGILGCVPEYTLSRRRPVAMPRALQAPTTLPNETPHGLHPMQLVYSPLPHAGVDDVQQQQQRNGADHGDRMDVDEQSTASSAPSSSTRAPKVVHFLFESNVGFRPRLSDADGCLGVQKLHALLGSGDTTVLDQCGALACQRCSLPLPSTPWLRRLLVRRQAELPSLEYSWAADAAWLRFVRLAPPCARVVMDDRGLALAAGLVACEHGRTANTDIRQTTLAHDAAALAHAAAAVATRKQRVPAESLGRFFFSNLGSGVTLVTDCRPCDARTPLLRLYDDRDEADRAPRPLSRRARQLVAFFQSSSPDAAAELAALARTVVSKSAPKPRRVEALFSHWLTPMVASFEGALSLTWRDAQRVVAWCDAGGQGAVTQWWKRRPIAACARLALLHAALRACCGRTDQGVPSAITRALCEALEGLTPPPPLAAVGAMSDDAWLEQYPTMEPEVCLLARSRLRLVATGILRGHRDEGALFWATAVLRCAAARLASTWLVSGAPPAAAPCADATRVAPLLLHTSLAGDLGGASAGMPPEWRAPLEGESDDDDVESGDAAPLILPAREWLQYQLRLLSDTHLDMLVPPAADDEGSGVVARSDAAWLARPEALAAAWPGLTNVLCVDQLPDLTAWLVASNPWHDTSRKKGRDTLASATIHPFFCKVLNNPCQRRCIDSIVTTAIERFPVLGTLLALQLRVFVLGNLPRATGVCPSVAARGVLNQLFRYTPERQVTHLVPFVRARRLTTLFAMREYYMTLAEASGVMDGYLGRSERWQRFKELARLASSNIRRCLWRAAVAALDRGARCTPGEALRVLDWAAIETGQKTTHGLAEAFHHRTIGYFVKVKKGRFEDVLLRKMTAAQSTFDDATRAELADASGALGAWLTADRRFELLRLFAWLAARQANGLGAPILPPVHDGDDDATGAANAAMDASAPGDAPMRARLAAQRRAAVPTHWLQVLGMSAAGLRRLRTWLFDYCVCEVKDDSFQKKAAEFASGGTRDYVLLKLFLRYFEHYREETGAFYLDARSYAQQALALRSQLRLLPWVPSPPLLGVSLFCYGCGKCAGHVAPPDTSTSIGALTADMPTPPAAWSTRHGARSVVMKFVCLDPATGRPHCRRHARVPTARQPAAPAAPGSMAPPPARGARRPRTAAERREEAATRRFINRLTHTAEVAEELEQCEGSDDDDDEDDPLDGSSDDDSGGATRRADRRPPPPRANGAGSLTDSGGRSDDDDSASSVVDPLSGSQESDSAREDDEDDEDDEEEEDEEEDEEEEEEDEEEEDEEEEGDSDGTSTDADGESSDNSDTSVSAPATPAPPPPRRRRGETSKQQARDVVMRILASVLQRERPADVTSADTWSCADPLWPVGMTGVWRTLHHKLYGLCNVCGRMALVQNAQMTTHGLVCTQHACARTASEPFIYTDALLGAATALARPAATDAIAELVSRVTGEEAPATTTVAPKSGGGGTSEESRLAQASNVIACGISKADNAQQSALVRRFWEGQRLLRGPCANCGERACPLRLPVLDGLHRLWQLPFCASCLFGLRNLLPVPRDTASLDELEVRLHAYAHGDGSVPLRAHLRATRVNTRAIPPVSLDVLCRSFVWRTWTVPPAPTPAPSEQYD